MSAPGLEFRCEECGEIGDAATLSRNSWGDPACPKCKSARIVKHRSRMSALTTVYFYFNVF